MCVFLFELERIKGPKWPTGPKIVSIWLVGSIYKHYNLLASRVLKARFLLSKLSLSGSVCMLGSALMWQSCHLAFTWKSSL